MSDKPRFTDFGLDTDFADALADRGIVHPFPIQELTLPLAFKGHDVIGQARTGTGKTLAFGLPLLQNIDTSRAETQALVVVPTRELCVQVADDLTIGANRGVTSIAVYGGVGYEEQIEALTSGVHVVVGTPGRTIDHLGRGNLDVSQIHTVVLDEADEMLDMGFLPDIEHLLADVPEQRQTMLFSATMPSEIVKLARRFMDKPTFMRADETLHETAPTVEQHFFLVHRMDKPRVLARLLQQPGRGGAFVFCRTKRMCDRLVRELDDLNVNAIAVHGDKRQASRERNLGKMRDGSADVLVATEVAARGLDVSNVTHVINYDCPDDEKMYLHRIGRTARAGESGVAVTFAQFNEVDRVNVIRKRVEADGELTEIFSTSDELTDLFDLPDTTPWDELGSSDSSHQPSSRSSGSSRSKSSKSSDRSRSTGRGSDRSGDRERRRSSRSGAKARQERRSSRESSSRRRSRSRSRTTVEAVVADAKQARDDNGDTPADDSHQDTSRERRPARTRAGNDQSRKDRSRGGGDAGRGGQPDDQPRRTTGGARPRSRRKKSKDAKTSGSDRRGGASQAKEGPSRNRSDNGGGNDRNDDGKDRKASGKGHEGGNGRSRPATTRRGENARGDGRPRPRRRVEVEHLP